MLVGQFLKKIITDISSIIKEDCSVWDTTGNCIASTSDDVEHIVEDVRNLLKENEDRSVQVTEKSACFIVRYEGETSYVFVIHRVIDNVAVMGKLCVNQFENTMHLYERSVDRNRFFQQLLLDNMLLVDVHAQAKKLKIDDKMPRVVFVIEPKKRMTACCLKR